MSPEPPHEADGAGHLDRLEGRIADLKEPVKRERTLALGLSLVFSLGTVVASCLFVGYLAGNWLKDRYHSELLGVLPLLLALGMAAVAAWRLLAPLLKD